MRASIAAAIQARAMEDMAARLGIIEAQLDTLERKLNAALGIPDGEATPQDVPATEADRPAKAGKGKA